jgi:hypothetical protein
VCNPASLSSARVSNYSIWQSNGDVPSLPFECQMEPKRETSFAALLDLMVLQVVASSGPTHGYAIAERLLQVSQGRSSSIWAPSVHVSFDLEQRGLIRAKWHQTESHRRARFTPSPLQARPAPE